MKLFEIGKEVKGLRKEQGITQEELAKLAGLSRVTLGKIEQGQMGATSIKSLDIILDRLGYEIDFKSKDGFGVAIFG
jgi:transcriptional regulator with XRE-family HTH domain